jgi:hypothetical protein
MFNFFNEFNIIKKNQSISIVISCFIYAYSTFIKNYILIYKITNADIPKKWQISFQDSATVSMVGIIDIHHTIMFWLVYIFFYVIKSLWCFEKTFINFLINILISIYKIFFFLKLFLQYTGFLFYVSIVFEK